MNQKIKDALGVVAVLAVLSFAYAAASYVNTYSKSTEAGFRSFSVSGEGKAVTVPDVAQFSFTVITEGGKDIGKLQKENTDKANKAIAFLKAKGVDAKDIRTESYNLEPRYEYYQCGVGVMAPAGVSVRPCPPASIAGYTIRQSVSVKVRDFAKIGDIMSGVVGSGANEVSSLNFTIDDPSKPRNDARIEAIAKARASAEQIAKASGFRLGRLLFIDEGVSAQPYYNYGRDMGASSVMEKAAAPSIEPGSKDVTVTVTLRYEIE